MNEEDPFFFFLYGDTRKGSYHSFGGGLFLLFGEEDGGAFFSFPFPPKL